MQNCSLIRKNRKRGPAVWLLRWSDKSDSGKRIYRKRVIGTVDEYPDSESVRLAIGGLIRKINAANPRIGLCSTTLAQLSDHFELIELGNSNTWRSYSTKQCYAGYLKRWIVPQWGKYDLRDIKTIEVESWLRRPPLRTAVARRSAASCPFYSTMPADMNCSTATQFSLFAREQSAERLQPFLLRKKSDCWLMVWLFGNAP